ncbi:MAG: endonuclease III [Desulfurococcales archaeon]|nr:endonuclease III [Desulfurococcales archaeon]
MPLEAAGDSSCSIASRAPGDVVFDILKSNLKVDWRDYVVLVADKFDGNPFAVLAAIILSQNTSDKNSIKAYERLREKIGVHPQDIVRTPLHNIIEAIRPAGLPKQKAEALIGVARLVLEHGGEKWLVQAPPEELRRELLKVKGVGKKTVDVFLSFYRRYRGVFAVDTHAARIAKRWGLVREKATYDEVSRALLEYFGPDKAEEAHRLLIALGRRYCRAKNPRCDKCPLRGLCPWPEKAVQAGSRQLSRGGSGGRSKNSGT